MANPAYSKTKGTQYETDLVKYLRSKGFDVERLRLNGREDEGDLVLKFGGIPYIIEAKNVRQMNLGGWVNEAEVEAKNYADHRGIDLPFFLTAHKRRNQPICNSYVTIPLWQYLDQLRAAGVPF